VFAGDHSSDGEILRAAVEQDWRALQHVLAWPEAEERLLTERLLEATRDLHLNSRHPTTTTAANYAVHW
jgi:hypothetical protein